MVNIIVIWQELEPADRSDKPEFRHRNKISVVHRSPPTKANDQVNFLTKKLTERDLCRMVHIIIRQQESKPPDRER
jgi:hypothetical protein